MILKLLMQMQWRLNLHECSKLRIVIFNEKSTLIIFFDEGVLSADGDVVNAHIGIMSTAKFYFVDVVEVDNMQLFLLFMIVFWGINLKRFDYDVVFFWFDYFEDLEVLFAEGVRVFEFGFAEFAVKSLPNVRRHMHPNLLILISTQPLTKAFNMYVLHRARTFAWRDEWIILLRII